MADSNGTFVGVGAVRNQYWYYVEKLVLDAREWANAVKLNGNLRNPDTQRSVWHVFLQYYDGDFGRLSMSISRRQQQCLDDLGHVNAMAAKLGFGPAPYGKDVLNELMDYDCRKDWLAMIEKHRKKGDAVSPRELMHEVSLRAHNRAERQKRKQERLREKAEESRRRRDEMLEKLAEAERQEMAQRTTESESVEMSPELKAKIEQTRQALFGDEEDS